MILLLNPVNNTAITAHPSITDNKHFVYSCFMSFSNPMKALVSIIISIFNTCCSKIRWVFLDGYFCFLKLKLFQSWVIGIIISHSHILYAPYA